MGHYKWPGAVMLSLVMHYRVFGALHFNLQLQPLPKAAIIAGMAFHPSQTVPPLCFPRHSSSRDHLWLLLAGKRRLNM